MIATKQCPPFRAEHLGSLLRPKELTERRIQLDNATTLEISQDEKLREIENRSINEIVKLQLDLGFHAINDGEYRRHQFWGTFFPNLEGFEEISVPGWDMFRMYVPDIAAFTESGHKPGESIICTGKIKHVGSSYLPDWSYLKNLVPAYRVKELKVTLAAPNWYHLRYKKGMAYPESVYANDAEYFKDIAEAYRTELRILYENGCRNVTIDDPNLAYFCSEKMLAGFKADGEDPDKLLDTYVQFLEYDTERAGTFEPLRELPANKNVVLGVVTSKFPALEDIGEMQQRVFAAADIIAQGSGQMREEALKRMSVSPQCGFASHHLGNSVTKDDMVAKLQLVRKLADTIWPGEP